MKYAIAAITLAACASGDAFAGKQAISTSMAECAAIYDVLAEMGDVRGEDATKIDRFRSGAEAFRASAVTRAAGEGLKKPDAHIKGVYQAKHREWSDKWLGGKSVQALMSFNEDKEWIPYCRKMGKAYGVPQG